MKLTLVILALFVAALVFLSMRKRRAAAGSRATSAANTPLSDTAKFHAVSLKTGSFTHHADRRGGDDRRTPYPSPIGLETGVYEKDQRQEVDRRKNPPNPF